MAKLYTKDVSSSKNLKPKKETIDFLLNYSKALSVTKFKKLKFESLLN